MVDQVSIPLLSRTARVNSASINEEARTAEVVFTTGSMVRRFDWLEGEYDEVLEVSETAMRMDRLNSGAPLLADHCWYDLEKQHGVVERAWIESGEGRATVRFAKDEKSESIWQKVKDKIVRNVSVGYNVHAFQEIIVEGGRRILRAIDWEPMEISLVAVGADAKAGIRAETTNHPCILQRAANTNGDQSMITENKEGTEPAAPAVEPTDANAPAAPAADASTPAAPATAETESRALEIMQLCQLGGVSLGRASEFVAGKMTVAEVRAALVNERAARSTQEIDTQQKPAADKESGSTAKRMARQFKKS